LVRPIIWKPENTYVNAQVITANLRKCHTFIWMVLRKHTLQKRDGLLLQIVCFMKSPQMFVHAGK